MGFIRTTCAQCKGKGKTEVPLYHSVVQSTTCSNCNGEGTIVSHSNAVGSSYVISVDPADEGKDGSWATLWRRHEDGELEILDSGKVRNQ